MQTVTLEDIIRTYIQLPSHPNGTGWFSVLCKVCNDHGRKGPRAGFMFDGDSVAYHCFNCGHATGYDPAKFDPNRPGSEMPQKMEQVLRAFGVPEDEWSQVLMSNLKARDGGLKFEQQKKQQVSIEPLEVPLPDIFYRLDQAGQNDKWAMIARDYLENERGVDPNTYGFMLSKHTDDPALKKWFGRLIIPIYKGEKLIYYVGRALGERKKKYESPSISRDKVIYGFDRLFEQTDLPLYVVEGWFDAHAIGGVALLGNEISDTKATWLNRSRRPKVYIPDQFGDGQLGGERALRLGWNIATPDVGDCKDMSEAVHRYGKIYVIKTIAETTASGFEAQTNLGVYCKHGKDARKKKTKETLAEKG